jgi:hypothetical protein
MDLADLVRAILSGDLLSARQWVADSQRARIPWERFEKPAGLDEREMTVAAGLAELLAGRVGMPPPPWTMFVGPQEEVLVLDPGLERMPRTFERAKRNGPEPLRKRNLIATPDFLDIR